MKKSRTSIIALFIAALAVFATGCAQKSDTVSHNLSNAADNYQVFRQIVVYNTFTDKYIMEVDGYCSLGNNDTGKTVSYTCKTGNGNDTAAYTKDIIEQPDNVLVYEHQLHPIHVSDTYFKVTLRPETVVPDINLK